MRKTKNPLNDDHYDGNDEQIQDLKDALNAVVVAARNVVANWSKGDLAGAVNQLESAIEPYEGDPYGEEPVAAVAANPRTEPTVPKGWDSAPGAGAYVPLKNRGHSDIKM